uniref:Uncharacterized protein n=1 Tax=Lates calcarifer TaxID=8187 RepID=A0A4W6E0V9_LATCA
MTRTAVCLSQVNDLSRAERESLLRNDLRPAIKPFKGNKLMLRFATQGHTHTHTHTQVYIITLCILIFTFLLCVSRRQEGAGRRSSQQILHEVRKPKLRRHEGNPEQLLEEEVSQPEDPERRHQEQEASDRETAWDTHLRTHTDTQLTWSTCPRNPSRRRRRRKRRRTATRTWTLTTGWWSTGSEAKGAAARGRWGRGFAGRAEALSVPLVGVGRDGLRPGAEDDLHAIAKEEQEDDDVRRRAGDSPEEHPEPDRWVRVTEQDQILVAPQSDRRPAAAGGEKTGTVSAQIAPPVASGGKTDVRQRLGKRRYSPDRQRSPSPISPRETPPTREPIRDVHRRLGVASQDRGLYSNSSKDRKTGGLWSRLGSSDADSSTGRHDRRPSSSSSGLFSSSSSSGRVGDGGGVDSSRRRRGDGEGEEGEEEEEEEDDSTLPEDVGRHDQTETGASVPQDEEEPTGQPAVAADRDQPRQQRRLRRLKPKLTAAEEEEAGKGQKTSSEPTSPSSLQVQCI